MSSKFDNTITVGVLGGGQLGRMLIQPALDWDIKLKFLDPDPNAPCSQWSNFTCGRLTDYETVMQFGSDCDVITIEIENVNTQALFDLEKLGKRVFPQPKAIALIQDKRTQKEFYLQSGIPTAAFILTQNRLDVEKHLSFLPAVNKLGREGYDGRGVQRLFAAKDIHLAFDAPGLLEKLINFEKEIAVIVARNQQGEIIAYPPVEMVFHPEKNLVEYLFSPAALDEKTAERADAIARKTITDLNMVGLLAVEMFVTPTGEVLVNEIAPRPHNSGHHTIEANVTSQYEQHLRAILNLPLGDPSLILPSAMVNLLGEEGFEGDAIYTGMNEVIQESGVHVHLYGKKKTKPFRKMGHVTIVDSQTDRLREKVEMVKKTLKVQA